MSLPLSIVEAVQIALERSTYAILAKERFVESRFAFDQERVRYWP